MEEIYTNAYAAIREDPEFKPTQKEKDWKAETLKFKTHRLTHAQRKQAIDAKIQTFKAGGEAALETADDDDEE
jgi:large subunit ribosomal protein L5e